MAEKEKEKEKGKEKVEEAPPEKKSSMKWIVIAVVVLLVLGGGGFVSWKTFLSPAQKRGKTRKGSAGTYFSSGNVYCKSGRCFWRAISQSEPGTGA
jgi:flagellar basal body-associated protein FliL